MEQATIARPYAEALFRVAKKNLTQWTPLVDQLIEIGSSTNVQEMAANPKFEDKQIIDFLLSLLKSSQSNEELGNFIKVLVENDRIPLLPEIGAQFHELKNASEGSADATIVSAFPISDTQLNELLKTLEKRFGRKLKATVTVDNFLIGGIYIVVGDEVLDLSIRAKLQKMQETLVS